MPFLTGDDPGTARECWQISVPDDVYFRSAVWGQLYDLIQPENWEQLGAATPELYAALAANMLDNVNYCGAQAGSLAAVLTALYTGNAGEFWHRDMGAIYQDTAGLTPAQENDPVGRWEGAITGAPLLQVGAADSRPILGVDSVEFSDSGVGDLIAADAIASGFQGTDLPHAIFLYARMDENTGFSTKVPFSMARSTSGNTIRNIQQMDGSPNYVITFYRDDSGSSATVGASDDAIDTALHGVCVQFDGQITNLWIDDTIVASGAQDLGVYTPDQLTLGCLRRTGNEYYWSGDVVAFGVLQANISNQDWLDLYAELEAF